MSAFSRPVWRKVSPATRGYKRRKIAANHVHNLVCESLRTISHAVRHIEAWGCAVGVGAAGAVDIGADVGTSGIVLSESAVAPGGFAVSWWVVVVCDNELDKDEAGSWAAVARAGETGVVATGRGGGVGRKAASSGACTV